MILVYIYLIGWVISFLILCVGWFYLSGKGTTFREAMYIIAANLGLALIWPFIWFLIIHDEVSRRL